jgi:hypothetical protein
MTSNQLTAILAERVMGWEARPDRFLWANRGWIPRWKFQPMAKVGDAFRLLEQFAPEECMMRTTPEGNFFVTLKAAGTLGEAINASKSGAITLAIAQALGIEANL